MGSHSGPGNRSVDASARSLHGVRWVCLVPSSEWRMSTPTFHGVGAPLLVTPGGSVCFGIDACLPSVRPLRIRTGLRICAERSGSTGSFEDRVVSRIRRSPPTLGCHTKQCGIPGQPLLQYDRYMSIIHVVYLYQRTNPRHSMGLPYMLISWGGFGGQCRHM